MMVPYSRAIKRHEWADKYAAVLYLSCGHRQLLRTDKAIPGHVVCKKCKTAWEYDQKLIAAGLEPRHQWTDKPRGGPV